MGRSGKCRWMTRALTRGLALTEGTAAENDPPIQAEGRLPSFLVMSRTWPCRNVYNYSSHDLDTDFSSNDPLNNAHKAQSMQ